MRTLRFKRNNYFMFMLLLLLAGIFTGLALSLFLNAEGLKALDFYLIHPSMGIQTDGLFTYLYVNGIFLAILLILLSTSIIGVWVMAFLIFTRGVQVGLFSAYLLGLSFKNIGFIIIGILPQVMMDFIVLYVIGSYVIEGSLQLLYTCLKSVKIEGKKMLNHALSILLISFVMILCFSYLKSILIPLSFRLLG